MLACALLATLIGASSADAFGIERYALSATEEGGAADTQAASAPYELTAEVGFDHTGGEARELDFALPPGLSFNPGAAVQCTHREIAEGGCPDSAAVGVMVVDLAGKMTPAAVYDVAPSPGELAELAFTVDGVPAFIEMVVRTGSDYGLTLSVRALPEKEISETRLTLWGAPGEPSHDAQRGSCLTDGETDCAGAQQEMPLLMLPSVCATAFQSTARASSWEDPAESVSDTVMFGQLSGCGLQSFDPTIAVQLDTAYADEPAEYAVDLHVPQSEDSSSPMAQLDNAQIALPVGTSLNLGGMEGLQSCGEAESALTSGEEVAKGEEDTRAPTCPSAAMVGTVEIDSALIEAAREKRFEGQVYVLQSRPPELKLLLAASADGVNLKLVASARLNEATGQVALELNDLPQLAISDIKLRFFGGARALLANPQTCGIFPVTSVLAPWSGGPDATPSSSFALTAEANDGACASPAPFAPTLTANPLTAAAGSYSPLTLQVFTRPPEQNLSRLSFGLPPGLDWMFASVPACGGPQAADGMCASASEIGTATIAAGASSYPASLIGAVYLTEGYAGGKYGLSIAIPTTVGPFALPEVIVRAAIDVSPVTGALSIVGDPLPQIVNGVPLRIQTVEIAIEHPDFVHPTFCESRQIAAIAEGTQGTTAQMSNTLESPGCQGSSSTGPPPAPAEPSKLSFSGSSVAVRRGGIAAIKFTCTGVSTCSGKLMLEITRTARGRRTKTTTIATGSFSIPAGRTVIVTLKLNAAGRALLKAHHGRLSSRLKIVESSDGSTSTQDESVRLLAFLPRPPHRSRRHS
jgi:hypothetical protein